MQSKRDHTVEGRRARLRPKLMLCRCTIRKTGPILCSLSITPSMQRRSCRTREGRMCRAYYKPDLQRARTEAFQRPRRQLGGRLEASSIRSFRNGDAYGKRRGCLRLEELRICRERGKSAGTDQDRLGREFALMSLDSRLSTYMPPQESDLPGGPEHACQIRKIRDSGK